MKNIMLNTFKEIVRNKFLYLIIFFAFLFIVFSILLWKLTIWDDNKMITDFWLAMIEVFWLIGVLFVWSQLLFKEVEWKTIFLILSKPIKRYEFILGKFFWFSMTIWLIVILQSIVFLIVLFLKDIEITHLILFSILFTFFKLEIFLWIVFFLSTFMSNILTIIVSMLIYILSHSFSLILDMVMFKTIGMWKILEWTINTSIKILQLLFPPFESLNIKDVIWSFQQFHANFFILNTFYSIFYLAIILFFTIIIFNKKKFEN